MNGRSPSRILFVLVLGLALGLAADRASAQQLILKGEFGLKAGTMAPPGLYAGMMFAPSWANALKEPDGNSLPSNGGSFNQYPFAPLVSYVSKFKLLGANYGAMLAVPFTDATIDFPRLNVGGSTGTALSQLWVVPFLLGWHFTQADLTFHYAFYAPTGRYTPGATNNTGLGMWCNEFSLRGTVFFDQAKTAHVSASLFYDINSNKTGSVVDPNGNIMNFDWKTGNPFTLMWGVGGDYGSGKLFKGWAGVAGYAQWQVTSTTGADVPQFIKDNKTQIYALGPELTTLQGALTIRYFWQFGGKFSTQGSGLYLQFVMPI